MTDRILNIGQFLTRAATFPRVKLTLRSHPMPRGSGDPTNESDSCDGIVQAIILDGSQVRAFFAKIVEEQGLGLETPDGVLVWLPWPFAAITVQRIQ